MPQGNHRPRPTERPPLARVRRGVIGILLRGEEMLLIRRAAGVAKPGYWCFPGGHVEVSETPRQAVCRELREELGIEVFPKRRVGSVRVLDTRHLLAVWQVVHVSGEFRPACHEIADVCWMTAHAVRHLQMGLPSNERVLQLLGW